MKPNRLERIRAKFGEQRLFRCAALLVVLLAALPAAAQTDPPAPTRPEIETRRDALPQESQDEAINAALASYKEALDAIARKEAAQQAEQAIREMIAQAPTRLEAIRQELQQPLEAPAPEVLPEDTTERLVSQFEVAKADLDAAKAQAAELEAEGSRRDERRTAIPTEISAARQKLQETSDAIAALPPAPEGPRDEARRAALLTTRDALKAEIARLEAELAGIEARRELLPARRDQSRRRLEIAQRRVDAWEQIVSERRAKEQKAAEDEARRLRREAARKHPFLQEFATKTEELVKQAGDVEAAAKTVERQTSDIESQTSDVLRRFGNVQRRLELSGLDRATGLFLRSQYERLQSRNELDRLMRATQQRFSEVSLRLLEREEELAELGDTAEAVRDNLIAQVKQTPPEIAVEEVSDFALELARKRRETLNTLIERNTTLERRLEALLESQKRLGVATDDFRDFIEERILWTRSVEGGVLPNLKNASDSAIWLFASPEWLDGLKSSGRAMLSRPVAWLVGLVLLLGAFGVRRECLRRLDHFGDNVSRYKTDSFAYTLRATYLTAIAAAPWPALFLFVGLALTAPADQFEVARVSGVAFIQTGLTFYLAQLLRVGLRPNGLGDAHFRWSDGALKLVRHHLAWFVPVAIPFSLVVNAMEASNNTVWNDSLGRLAFVVLMGALFLFVRFVLRPKGALISPYLAADEAGWISRLRYIWFPAILGIPFALALASLLGYHYTALQFQLKIEYTLLLLLIVATMNAILMRWLFIARRRLAIEDAKRRREAATEKGEQTAQTEAPQIDENKLDLPAISAATKKLFRSAAVGGLAIGLLLVWGDTLPALRMLDTVQLWPTIGIVDQTDETAAASTESDAAAPAEQAAPESEGSANSGLDLASGGLPSPGTQSTEQPADSPGGLPQSLTLADVGLAIVILVFTVVAFRNLPALIEIIVLRRLPLDASARYALSAVLRYAIAIVGIAAAFSALGLSWSKVQWLAAALTFGLAFGLQEIFANFVSGLIILGERPVRIGDTVTVGDVTGTVARIRMRATTITDWDRKELIIPNKTFITERVINWTLSDPVLRVIIPVGVSYGSDVKLVEKTLLKVARAHKFVLKDPPPFVLFKAFGDSTLDFELRVFIPHIEHLVTVRHELHVNITKAFRDESIEIAFPQRDLHIRSIADIEKFVAKREDLAKEEVQSPSA